MAKEESLVPFIYVLMLWQIPKTCNIKRENPYCSSIFMPFVNPPKERKKSISAKLNIDASTIQKAITWVLKVSKKALDSLLKFYSTFSGLDMIQEVGWDFLCFSGKLGFDGNEGGVICSAFGVTQLLLFSWLHIAHIESFLLGLEFKLSHQGAGWWHSIEAVEWCNPHFPFCLVHDFSTPTIIFLA